MPSANLPAWGIVEQVRAAQRLINAGVQRVVFMGMGEPFLNYSQVSRAIFMLQEDRTQTLYTDCQLEGSDETCFLPNPLLLTNLFNENRSNHLLNR